MGLPDGVFARDKKRQELQGGAGNHRHGGELDIRQVVEGLLVRDQRRVVGEIIVLAVQDDVVDVARAPHLLHVAIDVGIRRTVRERRPVFASADPSGFLKVVCTLALFGAGVA